MPILLRPHDKHQFRAGDPVYFLCGSHRLLLGGKDSAHMVGRPVQPVPAIVVIPGQCFSQITFQDGRRAWISPYDLAFRGFCPACGVPAALDTKRRLICPSCGAETLDAGLLILELPNLLKLFNDPTVRAQILHACAST
jgi:hypothetical protein